MDNPTPLKVHLTQQGDYRFLVDFSASIPALLGLLLAAFISPRLNILALGDRVASGLGVAVARTRLLGVIAIALLCGAAVSVAGRIPWRITNTTLSRRSPPVSSGAATEGSARQMPSA